MTVRCKFKCNEVTKTARYNGEGFLYTAKFSAVYDNSPENKAFFDATPNGQLSVGTYKEDHFTVGKEYYLDITPAE